MKALRLAVICFIGILCGCGGSGLLQIPPTISISPTQAALLPGAQLQFQYASNSNAPVEWSAPDGGVVVDGLFTAPASAGTYRVRVANLFAPNVFAEAVVTVGTVQVTVSPSSVAVTRNSVNPDLFTALVAGTGNRAVTWTVLQPGGGTIVAGTPDGSGNARGSYTAPALPGYYNVKATSVADPTAGGTATVHVLGGTSIALSPTSATVGTAPPDNTLVLTAVTTDANGNVETSSPVTWDIPVNPVGASLGGSAARQRTLTIPTNFAGTALCIVRVRNQFGIAATSSITVRSN